MKAKDVLLTQISTEHPEQYDARDKDGNKLGYIRIRWGFCNVWCPDETSNKNVYSSELKSGFGAFGSNTERKKHLTWARVAIAKWWNENPNHHFGKCN